MDGKKGEPKADVAQAERNGFPPGMLSVTIKG
jgi:hypothetical protein